jgi:hypothetical protein
MVIGGSLSDAVAIRLSSAVITARRWTIMVLRLGVIPMSKSTMKETTFSRE